MHSKGLSEMKLMILSPRRVIVLPAATLNDEKG
jgi:hypothetical protein